MTDLDTIAIVMGWRIGRSNRRAVQVLCPPHAEKTPSLRIWRDSQRYFCHGCHAAGSVAELVAIFTGEEPAEVEAQIEQGRWLRPSLADGQLDLPLPEHVSGRLA